MFLSGLYAEEVMEVVSEYKASGGISFQAATHPSLDPIHHPCAFAESKCIFAGLQPAVFAAAVPKNGNSNLRELCEEVLEDHQAIVRRKHTHFCYPPIPFLCAMFPVKSVSDSSDETFQSCHLKDSAITRAETAIWPVNYR